MIEIGLRFALELRDYALGQHLAESNSPLVEPVEIPNDALRKNGMFVKGQELPSVSGVSLSARSLCHTPRYS